MLTETKRKYLKKSPPWESDSSKCEPSHDSGIVNADRGGAIYMTYAEQIKHPNWQKKRLEILQNNNFTCQLCGNDDKELNVHHVNYDSKRKVWEYDDYQLLVLCKSCHNDWHYKSAHLLQMLANVFPHINGFGFDDIDTFIAYMITRGYDERRAFIKMMKDDMDGGLPL